LDLNNNDWSVIKLSGEEKCQIRDDHASFYDSEADAFYVFGGYVNGDKANDLWKFEFKTNKWAMLHPGNFT
jgi:hypothetical protein